MNPRHVNPTSLARTAIAPYNFIPLPNQCFTVEEGVDVGGKKIRPWESHHELVPGTHSGWIELEIRTLTPLYVRGRISRREGVWDRRESRLRPEPFTRADGTPLIPGSSLRGMVRNLVEILAFAKIQPVTRAQPFFRTVANDRIGKAYRDRLMRGGNKPLGGILRIEHGTVLIEPREVLRVERNKLSSVTFRQAPDYKPPWPPQHSCCWVTSAGDDVSEIRIQDARPGEAGAWRRGILVLTGNAPKKKREFVFLDPGPGKSSRIRVPQAISDRFHDQDQMTQWQERAFPMGQPANARRRAPGHLRDGEPIFFLTDAAAASEDNPDALVFMGRAQMFRFPYDRSPMDLIPAPAASAPLDLAEVMFGRVGKVAGLERQALKGRVFCEDAVGVRGGPDWTEEILVPRILSSPKPTTFQHYLTQNGTRNERQLTTYLEDDRTTIRGHKLYWHRWDESQGLGAVRDPEGHAAKRAELVAGRGDGHKQHTIIRPVKAGVTFGGRVRFENLTDIELGALLCALELPEGCAHKLGMAKPLGLGSIRIKARLRLVDRSRRYERWADGGVVADDGVSFRAAFTHAILGHAQNSQEVLLKDREGLRRIARLDALYQLLEWQNRPEAQATRYMAIEGGDAQRFPADRRGRVNEFRSRPVLPSPHGVAGLSEPGWQGDLPRPGAGSGAAPEAPAQQARRPPAGRELPRSHDRVKAELLPEKTKKGGWRAKHVGTGIAGHIQNSVEVPPEKKAGDRMDLIVAYATEREIAFRYPTDSDG